ncbi:hypothetical protein GGS21DRAFT_491529 [Xylaria nigripes]|nr:hypothetical protein GGS21DRAFT_491529 [Xylaria nigripes]
MLRDLAKSVSTSLRGTQPQGRRSTPPSIKIPNTSSAATAVATTAAAAAAAIALLGLALYSIPIANPVIKKQSLQKAILVQPLLQIVQIRTWA